MSYVLKLVWLNDYLKKKVFKTIEYIYRGFHLTSGHVHVKRL